MRKHLKESYPRTVRYTFKDFPIEQIHPWSRIAAIAGRCVYIADPNKFWQFHDWAFATQDHLTLENFADKFAAWETQNGVDPKSSESCRNSKPAVEVVDRNFDDARSLGVNRIPAMFINGRPVIGSQKWEQVQQIIELELAHAKPPVKRSATEGTKAMELTSEQ